MRGKKVVYYCTYLQLQLKGLQGGTLCGPVFCNFLGNRIVIKKTAVLNPGDFFSTCQVRVVRFYVSCLPVSAFFSLSPSPPPPSSPRFAVISARLQQGAPDCSGQRRTSTGSSRLQWAAPGLNSELQIAVGSAGAEWAAPDLTRGPPERSGQRRASAARRYVRRCVRRCVTKECQKICQKICQ